MQNKYIIRKDTLAKTFSYDKAINIKNLLEKEYAYIYENILDENYDIQLIECDIFREVLSKSKVVGFVTYNLQNKSHYILTNFYTIPGYVQHNLFNIELKYQILNDRKISIYEPSKRIVNNLLKLNYAKKITDSLVVSAINFNMNTKTLLSSTGNVKKNKKSLKTSFYDLNICSTLSFKVFNRDNYEVYYTPLNIEDNDSLIIEKRDNIGKSYFDSLVNQLISNDLVIERWMFLLHHNLPSKEVDIEKILGTTTQPSQIFQENIEAGIISQKEAKIIQNQLFMELRLKQVTKEALELRLNYLIENIHEKRDTSKNNENACPYCNEITSGIENYCYNCGYTLYDISSIDEEKFVYEDLLEEKQSYKYSLYHAKEKKNHHDEEYLITISICDAINNIEDSIYGDRIYEKIAAMHGISYINLKQVMIDKGLIDYTMDEEKWKISAQVYDVKRLKNILKEHNCKVSGNKYQLIERIRKEVPLENLKSTIPSVTNKGYAFKIENEIYLFHDLYLEEYIFKEFRDFVNENQENDLIDNAIRFLEKHIEFSNKIQDHDQLVTSLKKQSEGYALNGMYYEQFINELKVFIININMIYVDSHHYHKYQPIDEISMKYYYNVPNHLTKEEIRGAVEEVFKSYKKDLRKISYNDTNYYFEQALKKYTVSDLNKKIKRKYYKTRNIKTVTFNKNNKTRITSLDSYLGL